jgi:hypothetical protein
LLSPEVGQPLRLALDQNFPTDLLKAIRPWLPAEVVLEHVADIDPRLSDLDDDDLVVALRQSGFDGLVTNNYRMLEVPHELAAIIATKAVVVAIVGMGHDPVRAAGALLLELPGLPSRLLANQANVFALNYAHRRPTSGWDALAKAARKSGSSARTLWEQHKPDMESPIVE